MIKLKWDGTRISESFELPGGWVFFCFRQGEEPLWCGITPNLAQRLNFIRKKAEIDTRFAEVAALADSLDVESQERSVDALIRLKIFLGKNSVPHQQMMQPSLDYAYLALDARRFPFVTLKDDTNDHWTYAGPWRGRFLLYDVMDSLGRILKLPYCETENYPCEKLDQGICKGWCLALENGEDAELKKLDTLLNEAYLHPQNGILEMVAQERDKYFDDLDFAKADLLDEEIERLQSYRDWLNFLYVTKSLSWEEEDFGVENGLLRWCKHQGMRHDFPREETPYRENEMLAVNLNDLDERRILYEYHVKHRKG